MDEEKKESKENIVASENMKNYFDFLEKKSLQEYEIAKKAREKKLDPVDFVEIKLVANMAERVVGIISVIAPQIENSGAIERIIELEKKYAPLDWRVALQIGLEVAQEKFCKFKDQKEAIEVGIRTGFAYVTVGVVSAPLEGFIGVTFKDRNDKRGQYLALNFAGPIRNAGGTAAAVSVIIADYIRKKMNIDVYDPGEREIKRCFAEISDYHDRVTNLQYFPSEKEVEFLLNNLPVEIDGDPSEKIEVSNYKDLPRVKTNFIRSGFCLIHSSCIPLKAPKLWKQLSKWSKDFDMEQWSFLEEFIKIQKEGKAKQSNTEKKFKEEKKEEDSDSLEAEEIKKYKEYLDKKKKKIVPNYTFIQDLVAGRPVFSYPSKSGGFRLRYGRGRISGYSAQSVNPALMELLNEFIAIGTQLKIERPGKGAVFTPCDVIDGPVVKLKNGDVLSVNTINDAKKIKKDLLEILYLGDVLINYGDFFNRNHVLVPPGYCEEWWAEELFKKFKELFASIGISPLDTVEQVIEKSKEKKSEIVSQMNIEEYSQLVDVEKETFLFKLLNEYLKNPFDHKPSFCEAYFLSTFFNVPLHPKFTFFYNEITRSQFFELSKKISHLEFFDKNDNRITEISVSNFRNVKKSLLNISEEKKKILEQSQNYEKSDLNNDLNIKRILEIVGVPHENILNETLIFDSNITLSLFSLFSLENLNQNSLERFESYKIKINENPYLTNVDLMNCFSSIAFRDKSGTFIGGRMGRPEKAKMRKMDGSPHVLFPLGTSGGRMNSFQTALESGVINASFNLRYCENCKEEKIYQSCEDCGNITKQQYYSLENHKKYDDIKKAPGDRILGATKRNLNIHNSFGKALDLYGSRSYPALIKGVKKLSNRYAFPEQILKGILRSKNNIYVNKDGTIRYDCSELPITHFKPKEIGISIEKLHELDYVKDIYGKEIVDDEQIVEIKPQDIIIPCCPTSGETPADEVLFNTSKFIDELLEKLYGLKPYYNLKNKKDLIGQLVIGLAPHTSAGTLGRIIGFSQSQSFFAHPMYHAAMRRDCDGDESCFFLLLDGFINFSQKYLPETRGSTMDCPLVLTSILTPGEVDDMVFDMDVVKKYPLEFYESCVDMKMPWEFEMKKLGDNLGTEKQYEGALFTHDTSNINSGVLCSAYKTLPSMKEKLEGQMKIARSIRAVKASDVAELVITKHFLKDTKGTLRKFSMQKFRCTTCDAKYRRPPLIGKCMNCGENIIFTVPEGSVRKYLEISLDLANKNEASDYLKQNLELLQIQIDSLFGKEKEIQQGLGGFF